jgi:hypothetical protein
VTGVGQVAGLVLTTASLGALPVIVKPDRAILLAPITPMYSGTIAGGPELLPVLVVHCLLHSGGLDAVSAKPLKAAGGGPPESEFSFHQFEPHHSTSSVPGAPY